MEEHTCAIKIFRETADIEAAIKKQISKAIDETYLKPLRNMVSNIISQPLPDIFPFLFQRYKIFEQVDLK